MLSNYNVYSHFIVALQNILLYIVVVKKVKRRGNTTIIVNPVDGTHQKPLELHHETLNDIQMNIELSPLFCSPNSAQSPYISCVNPIFNRQKNLNINSQNFFQNCNSFLK